MQEVGVVFAVEEVGHQGVVEQAKYEKNHPGGKIPEKLFGRISQQEDQWESSIGTGDASRETRS